MNGWIKLNRKFLEWEWIGDPNMVSLFIILLLQANTKDKTWRGQKIKRGQYLTSLNTLHEKTGLSKQKIRTCLQRLKITKEINTETNTRYTLITINKYDSYQSSATTTNTQTNTPLTHEQHTSNTNIRIIRIKRRKEKGLNFNFSASEFCDIWFDWCEYKNDEHGFRYKDKSEDAAIKKLIRISGGDMDVARKIVNESISNKWAGLFPLDEKESNTFEGKPKLAI